MVNDNIEQKGACRCFLMHAVHAHPQNGGGGKANGSKKENFLSNRHVRRHVRGYISEDLLENEAIYKAL